VPFFPDNAIVTACIPGCPNRVSWDYDDGEPQTWEHPGYPAEIFPAMGCRREHLFALGMPYDYPAQHHDAWQRVHDFERLQGTGHMLWITSLQHIAGPGNTVTLDNFTWIGRRRFRIPMAPVWDQDDDDLLPF
jgi:hypothetical protein